MFVICYGSWGYMPARPTSRVLIMLISVLGHGDSGYHTILIICIDRIRTEHIGIPHINPVNYGSSSPQVLLG